MSGKTRAEEIWDRILASEEAGKREMDLGVLHMASALAYFSEDRVEQDLPRRQVTLVGRKRRLVVRVGPDGDNRIRRGRDGEFVLVLNPGTTEDMGELLAPVAKGMGYRLHR